MRTAFLSFVHALHLRLHMVSWGQQVAAAFPLDVDETALAQEMQQGLESGGPSYAQVAVTSALHSLTSLLTVYCNRPRAFDLVRPAPFPGVSPDQERLETGD